MREFYDNDLTENKKISNLHITNQFKKNYKIFLIGTLTGIIITSAVKINHQSNIENSEEIISEINENSEVITSEIDKNNYKSIVPIKVYYEVKAGDTLSEIADKYEIKINSIKVNGKTVDKDELLSVGTELEFTYNITEDQITFATEQINTNNEWPDYMLAYIYHTDTETLYRLNEKNPMHDTILVPNFKGIDELEEEMEKIYGTEKVKKL